MTSRTWYRRALLLFGAGSILWIAMVAYSQTPPILEAIEPVSSINIEKHLIYPERPKTQSELEWDKFWGRETSSPVTFELGDEIDWPDVVANVKKWNPALREADDEEISDHVQGLIDREVRYEERKKEKRTKQLIIDSFLIAVVPPVLAAIAFAACAALHVRYRNRKPSTYHKTVFSIALFWILGWGCWEIIRTEGSLNYAFIDKPSKLTLFLPPIAFCVAAWIWAWARRPPQ